jgi:hypothetical protein
MLGVQTLAVVFLGKRARSGLFKAVMIVLAGESKGRRSKGGGANLVTGIMRLVTIIIIGQEGHKFLQFT